MSHKSIIINNISLSINQKICFENFSAHINYGKHILIMGRNGIGKSTLLKMIQNKDQPTTGNIFISSEIVFGNVPQIITKSPALSGGQRFNRALSQALGIELDILCLDEPTNHLDLKNKRSLIRMLQRYSGTLIIISHDQDILHLNFDEIWHIVNSEVIVFRGNYTNYLEEYENKQKALMYKCEQLQKEKNNCIK